MATIFARIREYVTASAHHALDEVENPHVMAQQVLRDLGEGVLQAERALVTALGTEKLLLRQRDQRLTQAADWEHRAERVLAAGDEKLARSALEKVVTARAAATALERSQRLDELAARSSKFEAEVEAAAELLGEQEQVEREVARVDIAADVDAAMRKLKERLAAQASQ